MAGSFPGLLTVNQTQTYKVSRPSEPWRVLLHCHLHFLDCVDLSSLLSTMKKADKIPDFRKDSVPWLVFFGLNIFRVRQSLQVLQGLPFPVLG